MRIIILGSEGFIGSSLVRHFKAKSWDVSGCDLYDKPSTTYNYFKISRSSLQFENIFIKDKYDACINASGSGNVNYSVTNPLEDFELNTFDTIRILDAIRKYNSDCRYVHISSAAVYGNPENLPVSELASCNPLSPYGWHKLMAEQLCKEYVSLYDLKIVITRPFSIYGNGLKKQLFWDIYQKYISDPTKITLWGSGEESRDFIHIDDVVHSMELILQKAPMKAEVYNIASGNETLIKDVVMQFFSSMPLMPKIIFNNETRSGDPRNWKADISNLRALGFLPGVHLQAGIQNLAEWLLQPGL
ncbi:MAG: SDR family oxidoreductase [Ferruginibacter sp.]